MRPRPLPHEAMDPEEKENLYNEPQCKDIIRALEEKAAVSAML